MELVVFLEISSGWIQDGQSLTQESKMAYIGEGHWVRMTEASKIQQYTSRLWG
jgi:uncharacterized protein YbdZ (MbtH family)